jgi:hypothetical protein
MLPEISTRIRKWAKGWLVLLLILAFVLFVNLPIGDPVLISKSLDGQIGYTPDQAFSTIASYGESGRTQMIWIHLGDFILIILYTAMFSLSISWLFSRGFDMDNKIHLVNLVPLFGGLFDVLENIWILILLLIYPTKSIMIGWLSTVFTTGKYILGLPIIIVIFIGFFKAAANRFKLKDDEHT